VVCEALPEGEPETSVNDGRGVPVPPSVTLCGEPVALSVTESVALRLAADAGEKVTEMVQLAPAASDSPQVFVWAKSAAFVPAIAMLVIDSAALPVLVSVAVCAALVAPLSAVNVSDGGVSDATGAATTTAVTVTVLVPVAEAKVEELFESGV
jgi:hypothetical protein